MKRKRPFTKKCSSWAACITGTLFHFVGFPQDGRGLILTLALPLRNPFLFGKGSCWFSGVFIQGRERKKERVFIAGCFSGWRLEFM